MNILIVGLGSIAKKHIAAIRRINNSIKLYALRSNPNADTQDGIMNIFDIKTCDFSFDFAIISNPTNLHYKYIELLTEKGINLFIEKPPLSSLENIKQLTKKTSEFGIITYVACNLRFHPCLQFLKDKLQSNNKIINEINVYCGSYLPDWRPTRNYREIYSAKSEMGGGVHLDLFHELDYLIWIFGIPKKAHSVLRKVSSLQIDSVDYANYLLEYDSFTANIILNYYRKDPKRSMEIVFEDETWNINLLENSIKDQGGRMIYHNRNFSIEDSYFLQMDYYINYLKAKKMPMNSLQESAEVLKICLLNESAKK